MEKGNLLVLMQPAELLIDPLSLPIGV